MIALIEFDEDMIITKKTAERLKLRMRKVSRVGFIDKKLKEVSSWEFFSDEIEEVGGNKYKIGEVVEEGKERKKISHYNIYERAGKGEYVKVAKGGHLVDLLWFVEACKIPFRVIEAIKPDVPTVDNISLLLKKIEDKTANVATMIDTLQQRTFNEKCNVHVGGGLIVTYNEVMLKEDSCTDELQDEMNKGWRIIACCVQPDKRRPDYILGRFNSDIDANSSINAKR